MYRSLFSPEMYAYVCVSIFLCTLTDTIDYIPQTLCVKD